MKKKLSSLLITVIICMFVNQLLAQSFYVSISGGGSLSSSTQNVPNFLNITKTSFTTTNEQIHLSFGQGANFGGSVGYMFNNNIGAELGLSYFVGAKTNSQRTDVGSTSNASYSGNMMRVIPTIIIATGMDKFNPYAKFGVVIGSGEINYSGKETMTTNVFLYDIKMNGGNVLGLSTSIGAQYKLTKQVVFFAEISTINLSYAPTKGVFTTATFNGANVLPSLTTKDKEFNFIESIKTTNSSASTPDSQPTTQLIQKFPFGSVGVNLGLKYVF